VATAVGVVEFRSTIITYPDRPVDEFGRSPTTTEMDTLSGIQLGTYENRFGSWTEALQSAGYEPVKQHPFEDAILDEITSVCNGDRYRQRRPVMR